MREEMFAYACAYLCLMFGFVFQSRLLPHLEVMGVLDQVCFARAPMFVLAYSHPPKKISFFGFGIVSFVHVHSR